MLNLALITGFDLSSEASSCDFIMSAGVSRGQQGRIPADLKATPVVLLLHVCGF